MRHGSLYFKVVKQNCGDIGLFRVTPSQSVHEEFKAFLSRHFEVQCYATLLGGNLFLVDPMYINVERVQITREEYMKRYPWMENNHGKDEDQKVSE